MFRNIVCTWIILEYNYYVYILELCDLCILGANALGVDRNKLCADYEMQCVCVCMCACECACVCLCVCEWVSEWWCTCSSTSSVSWPVCVNNSLL